MPVPPPPKPRSLVQKILTTSAISTTVGFGACSLGALANDNRISPIAIYGGGGLFFVSLAVLAITFVIFVVQEIREAFRK